MPEIIKDGKWVNDPWILLRGEISSDLLESHAGRDIIVPLEDWLQQQPPLKRHDGQIGVWLASHEVPGQLGDDITRLPVIGIDFPAFKDGRGFTSARELRERFRYEGEIRAIGDVLRDQLFYMMRCGINAFALRDDQDPEACLAALQDFRDSYQPRTDQPLPLFRRRA